MIRALLVALLLASGAAPALAQSSAWPDSLMDRDGPARGRAALAPDCWGCERRPHRGRYSHAGGLRHAAHAERYRQRDARDWCGAAVVPGRARADFRGLRRMPGDHRSPRDGQRRAAHPGARRGGEHPRDSARDGGSQPDGDDVGRHRLPRIRRAGRRERRARGQRQRQRPRGHAGSGARADPALVPREHRLRRAERRGAGPVRRQARRGVRPR